MYRLWCQRERFRHLTFDLYIYTTSTRSIFIDTHHAASAKKYTSRIGTQQNSHVISFFVFSFFYSGKNIYFCCIFFSDRKIDIIDYKLCCDLMYSRVDIQRAEANPDADMYFTKYSRLKYPNSTSYIDIKKQCATKKNVSNRLFFFIHKKVYRKVKLCDVFLPNLRANGYAFGNHYFVFNKVLYVVFAIFVNL